MRVACFVARLSYVFALHVLTEKGPAVNHGDYKCLVQQNTWVTSMDVHDVSWASVSEYTLPASPAPQTHRSKHLNASEHQEKENLAMTSVRSSKESHAQLERSLAVWEQVTTFLFTTLLTLARAICNICFFPGALLQAKHNLSYWSWPSLT